MQIGGQRQPTNLDWSEEKTLDKYHTHFLLLDNGRVNHYLDDRPRSDFVDAMRTKTKCHAITIIIEGGLNTLEVIRNDLKNKRPRPVVIIQGSGRLANVLATLIELSKENNALQYETCL
jgi:transient receptor potential cation channel subfamily M protein 3